MLLSQKAAHEILRQKVEALHQQIQEFTAIPKRLASSFTAAQLAQAAPEGA